MIKPKVFFLHYNKPASKAAGRNILSVHWNKQCLLVHGIICNVPLRTKDRKTQPRCVMAGKGVVKVVDNIAYIDKE